MRGNNLLVQVTDESWFSDDFQVNIAIKHVDPSYGVITMHLRHLTRTKPDPALFLVPPTYRIINETAQTRR